MARTKYDSQITGTSDLSSNKIDTIIKSSTLQDIVVTAISEGENIIFFK